MTAPIDPELLAEAVAMRAAGYTVSVISRKTGVSQTTLNRKLRDVARGSAKKELIERFKKDLTDSLSSSDSVKAHIASLIQDDIALTQLLREKAGETIEAIDTRNPALAARALAACATTLKVSSDTVRGHFRDGKPPIEAPPKPRSPEEEELDKGFHAYLTDVLRQSFPK